MTNEDDRIPAVVANWRFASDGVAKWTTHSSIQVLICFVLDRVEESVAESSRSVNDSGRLQYDGAEPMTFIDVKLVDLMIMVLAVEESRHAASPVYHMFGKDWLKQQVLMYLASIIEED